MKGVATDKRSFKCEGCDGRVKVPRKATLEQTRTIHNATCPGAKR